MLKHLPRLHTLLVHIPWFEVAAPDSDEDREEIIRLIYGRPFKDVEAELPWICGILWLHHIGIHYGPQVGGVLSH